MQIVPPFVAISNSIYKLIAVFFMFLLNIQGIQRKAEAEAVFAQQLVIIKPHCARRSSEALNLTFSFVNLVSRFVTLFSLFHFIFSMFFVVFFWALFWGACVRCRMKFAFGGLRRSVLSGIMGSYYLQCRAYNTLIIISATHAYEICM